MKDLRKILGNNIRKYRELRGYTQEKFIEKIEIGTTTISNIECGKAFVSNETLAKIIEVLDIEPHLLFIDTEDKTNFNAHKDFEKRYDLIKNDPQKFEILYSVLKVLS